MAEVEFEIAYDGPALVAARMPVRDLAPALLALGDLFVDVSKTLYPDREPVALSVKATNEGSFLVHLTLEAKSTWDEIVAIFASDTATALTAIQTLVIGPVGAGLFWLIKFIRGRRIAKREPLQPGTIRITLTDGTVFEVQADLLALYERSDVRRKAQAVVEPLRRDGIDEVRFSERGVPTVTITDDEVPAFDVHEEPVETLTDQEQTIVVEIVAPAFDDRKWRLNDGHGNFWASVEDESFLEQVQNGEAFRKGDMLRCRIRSIQTQTPTAGLHGERIVEEVIQHIPRPEQLRFDDGPGEGDPAPGDSDL